MSGTELSRVRPNSNAANNQHPFRHNPVQRTARLAPSLLGNALVRLNRQVPLADVSSLGCTVHWLGPPPPARSAYGIALLLMCPNRCLPALESSLGIIPRSCRFAATWKTFPSSNDQHEGQCRKRTPLQDASSVAARGSLPRFPLDSCG